MGGGWGNCVVCKISGKMLFKLKKKNLTLVVLIISSGLLGLAILIP